MIKYLENRLSFLDKLYSPSNKEVYTPLALVNEILDKLPKDVWDDINLRWLNPAVKNGVFLGAIILRLIKNYTEKGIFNTEQEAYNHIVKNQIYGYALSMGALRTANKLIYGSAKYEGNIIYGNILEEQVNMKFDVVIGNPPYQSKNKGTGRKGGGAAASIYPKFMLKGIEILNKNGYLALIVPPAWGKRTNLNKPSKLRIFESIVHDNTLLYLNQDVSNKFDVFTKIGYFLLKNSKENINTTVENSLGKFQANFRKLNFIPNIYSDVFEKIYYKTTNAEGFNPLFENIDPRKFNNNIPMWENCIQINYLNGNNGFDAKIRHLDIKEKGRNSQANFYKLNSLEEAESIKKLLNSKLFNFLNIYMMQDPYVYHNILNNHIIHKDFLEFKDDMDIYKAYDLTQEEIDYIEANV